MGKKNILVTLLDAGLFNLGALWGPEAFPGPEPYLPVQVKISHHEEHTYENITMEPSIDIKELIITTYRPIASSLRWDSMS